MPIKKSLQTCLVLCFWCAALSLSAQDDSEFEALSEALQQPPCFGFTDVGDSRALEICDALNLRENVKARELSEQWVRAEPDSPAAQFALSEVLLTIEGNMPRALYHLHRAEQLMPYQTLEQSLESGNLQWHYLTLTQLSYVHQLMGEQVISLEYLEQLEAVYGQDVESFRGWPLIKLKQYEAARNSARKVLENEADPRARARAWNTICAADLASLTPVSSPSACERAINEENPLELSSSDTDTVYLTNASEVALSLLEIEQAEDYLSRATRYLNPDSVADPWIYTLYLTLNQGRFEEAHGALERMLIWREQQEPIVSVMNRAEHFLVSANFLMVAGYADDAIRLSQTAMNQPDRNGSYSADEAQKDAYAALVNMHASRVQLEIEKENSIGLSWAEMAAQSAKRLGLRLQAWRAERRAASLFADFEVLQSRVRPYAPLDVHIPEWLEPELVAVIGTGIMTEVLDQALENGAFQLNDSYYQSYKAEILYLNKNFEAAATAAATALAGLPQQEVLLKARLSARLAESLWQMGDFSEANHYFAAALRTDPSVMRRLQTSLPVDIVSDNSPMAESVRKMMAESPRFRAGQSGLILSVSSSPEPLICLRTRLGEAISCASHSVDSQQVLRSFSAEIARNFHKQTFGIGIELSQAERTILMGSNVILSAQRSSTRQNSGEVFLKR